MLRIVQGSAWQAHTCTLVVSPGTEAPAATSHHPACGSSPRASVDASGASHPACTRPACQITSLQPHALSPHQAESFAPCCYSFSTAGIWAQARGHVRTPSHRAQQMNMSLTELMLPLGPALAVTSRTWEGKGENGVLVLPLCSRVPRAAELPRTRCAQQLCWRSVRVSLQVLRLYRTSPLPLRDTHQHALFRNNARSN